MALMWVFQEMSEEFDKSRRREIFFKEVDLIIVKNLFFKIFRDIKSDILIDFNNNLLISMKLLLNRLYFL